MILKSRVITSAPHKNIDVLRASIYIRSEHFEMPKTFDLGFKQKITYDPKYGRWATPIIQKM